jgi:hypothetical protein
VGSDLLGRERTRLIPSRAVVLDRLHRRGYFRRGYDDCIMVSTDSVAGTLSSEDNRSQADGRHAGSPISNRSKRHEGRERSVDVVIALSIVLILSPLLFALLISADISLLAKIVVGAIGMFLLTCLPFLALLLGGYKG